VTLHGSDDARQLVITAHLTDGRLADLTGDLTYDVANPDVARVLPGGRVVPSGNGTTTITARHGSHTVTIPVQATAVGEDLPIHFANEIVPIFTKQGCNAGACHGKQSGQNGFRLSLLGFDAEQDYGTLVKESRGRRLFPAAPDASLLLLKATGAIAHGGGRKLDPASDEYKLVRRWIAAGTPFGQPTDPVVTRISVFPEERTLPRQSRQQLAVYAHSSDGRVADVTRRAQYESNDLELSAVDASGLVRTLGLSGQAAVMVRFHGHVTVFRATVPLGLPTPDFAFPARTLVDTFTQAQWRKLGLVPSELCGDEQFLRRASLDLTGTLPMAERVRAFVASTDPRKREKLIDELLASPEYGYFFAGKWADVLRVKRRQDASRATATFAFHNWIREALTADKPYDEIVRDLLTATGDETRNPPVVWYKEVLTPEQFVDDVSQVFLGQRVACAQCHHHPYEKWGQDDYWSMAAFFGRLGRKTLPTPGVASNRPPQLVFTRPSGTVVNKRTGRPAPIKPLDGAALTVGPEDDPRAKLADWMTDPNNAFFARAVVNRYWAHFFGRGLVDPPDDLRVTNPPSNPELLDALAKEFVAGRYSLKALVRTICSSRTYQLSSEPNEWNRQDKQNYARYFPKRLTAEVLLDAVSQVTDSPTAFPGLPRDRHAPRRAVMLPDESYPSYFLDVFGRPQRISACECERVSETNMAQVIHLLSSEEVQAKLARAGGRADVLAKDPRPDAAKVEDLFLAVLSRTPTPDELDAALAHIEKSWANKKPAYENILWALLNTKEFLFVR
jgi:hypothetical protein